MKAFSFVFDSNYSCLRNINLSVTIKAKYLRWKKISQNLKTVDFFFIYTVLRIRWKKAKEMNVWHEIGDCLFQFKIYAVFIRPTCIALTSFQHCSLFPRRTICCVIFKGKQCAQLALNFQLNARTNLSNNCDHFFPRTCRGRLLYVKGYGDH